MAAESVRLSRMTCCAALFACVRPASAPVAASAAGASPVLVAQCGAYTAPGGTSARVKKRFLASPPPGNDGWGDALRRYRRATPVVFTPVTLSFGRRRRLRACRVPRRSRRHEPALQPVALRARPSIVPVDTGIDVARVRNARDAGLTRSRPPRASGPAPKAPTAASTPQQVERAATGASHGEAGRSRPGAPGASRGLAGGYGATTRFAVEQLQVNDR